EELRDALLSVSGKLDTTMGGLPVEIVADPSPPRRTIYSYIDRQNLPGLFRTFDFANPDSTSPQRFFTTVPQQALFLLNSPFVVQQAKNMVERPEIQSLKSDDQRIQQLYRIALQRAPGADELKLAQQFIHAQD